MNTTPIQIVDAVIKYMYNVSPVKVFEDVYGECDDPYYKAEKITAMKSLVRWWSQLDSERQNNLVNAALTRCRLNGEISGTPEKAFKTGMVF